MGKSIKYSQNFLKNRTLVAKLVQKSSIGNGDVVYEIGAGKGIITAELLKKAGKVVIFEIDKNLSNWLRKSFKNNNLTIINSNFLTYKLPTIPYKLFSNIPFNITADIFKKIVYPASSLAEGYLIIQKEAAKKFIGKPYAARNSQMAILAKPFFDIKVVYEFKRNDFYPRPKVNSVLIKIRKKEKPLIDIKNVNDFQDFVVYTFNKKKVATFTLQKWIFLFDRYLRKEDFYAKGAFNKQEKEQSRLQKIHRTRVNRNWNK